MRKLCLHPEEVHVWITDISKIDDHRQLETYRRMVSPEELEKADRYLSPRDRKTSLVTRALVRWVLSKYAGISPCGWEFVSNRYGRPEIKPGLCHEGLSFNVSHTDGVTVCGVSRLPSVGVDVERVDRKIGMNLAERFFAPPEVQELTRLSGDARQARLLDFWTLKEAYVKARGMGLSIPLNKFRFDLSGGSPAIVFEPEIKDRPDHWHFFRHTHAGRFKMAVAVSAPWVSGPGLKIYECVPFLT